jgi:hypothetical protein
MVSPKEPYYPRSLYNCITVDSPHSNECETAIFVNDSVIFVSDKNPNIVCNERRNNGRIKSMRPKSKQYTSSIAELREITLDKKLTFVSLVAKSIEKAFHIFYSILNRKSKLNGPLASELNSRNFHVFCKNRQNKEMHIYFFLDLSEFSL